MTQDIKRDICSREEWIIDSLNQIIKPQRSLQRRHDNWSKCWNGVAGSSWLGKIWHGKEQILKIILSQSMQTGWKEDLGEVYRFIKQEDMVEMNLCIKSYKGWGENCLEQMKKECSERRLSPCTASQNKQKTPWQCPAIWPMKRTFSRLHNLRMIPCTSFKDNQKINNNKHIDIFLKWINQCPSFLSIIKNFRES